MINKGIKGHFELKNIQFRYETRNNYIFEDFSIDLNVGKKIAFVGHSGCGKSTIFQLLQRFYEPSKGQILIDGTDIKDFDVHYLRSCFGAVSQEPVLFNGSFKYNIIYNMENVSEEEMIRAARLSNALSFIEGEEKLISEAE
jgi:ATP-binding cassette subfamily B (MDR/TAP) protein 1